MRSNFDTSTKSFGIHASYCILLTLIVIALASQSYWAAPQLLRPELLSSNNTATSLDSEDIQQWPQLLLLGDSITALGAVDLQTPLSVWYERKVDVLNRGLGGYNTRLGYQALQEFFPSLPPSSITPRVRILVVLFGTNDIAIASTSNQYVPLEDFRQNLIKIATFPGLAQHQTKVILVTTTPIDEWRVGNFDRTALLAATYAQVCREVGAKLRLPVLDLWTTFMTYAGWRPENEGPFPGSLEAPKNQLLESLLFDGAHFSTLGYQFMVAGLVDLISKEFPDELPENLPYISPGFHTKAV